MTETDNASATSTPTRGGLRRRLWIWGIPFALMGLPVLVFFAASALVDRTRIPPELAQLPPELADTTATSPPADPAPSEPDGSPKAAGLPSDSLVPLETKLADQGEQDGLRLYFRLSHIFMDWRQSGVQELNDLLYPDTDRKHAWRPGKPLPPGVAEWLVSHGGLVEDLLRLAGSPDLPLRQREAAARHLDATPFANDPDAVRFLVQGMGICMSGADTVLAAEGQRHAEAGDLRGALSVYLAMLRLSMNEVADAVPTHSRPVVLFSLFRDVRSLAAWVDANGGRAEDLTDLRHALAETHRCAFRQDWIARERQQLYLPWRQKLVTEANGSSWHSPAFGWDGGSFPWLEAAPNKYAVYALGLTWPRPGALARTAMQAMRNKREAPETLRQWDRVQAEIVRRGQMTWPELVQAGSPSGLPQTLQEPDPPLWEPRSWGSAADYDRWREDVLKIETSLNLLRAAIGWRLAPGDAKPDPAAMALEDRESPWRDPFAEAPFRAKALTGGGVLLYSLGPQLNDAEGQTEHDPTEASAGFLSIAVKR